MTTVDRIMELADAYACSDWDDEIIPPVARATLLTALQEFAAERDAYQVAADKLAGELKDMQQQEPVLGTKTWIEGGVVMTQNLTQSDIYKPAQPVAQQPLTEQVRILRSLLGASLGALQYHTDQTRPIERTKETIRAIEHELAAQPVAQPLPMTDEEYTHLTTAGAKAWAGVNAQELREGGPVAQPLTDDQIEVAYRELYRNQGFGQTTYEMVEAGIRYAEKHHGIGAKEHGTP